MTGEGTVRILVQKVANSRIRCYHVYTRISNKQMEIFKFPLDDSEIHYIENMGPVAEKILLHLNTVDGIKEVMVQPQQLTVDLYAPYGWKDVEADVLYAIETVLGVPTKIEFC